MFLFADDVLLKVGHLCTLIVAMVANILWAIRAEDVSSAAKECFGADALQVRQDV